MIGFAAIAGGAPSTASSMTNHLLGMSLPTTEADLARYYQRGMQAGTPEEREVDDLARRVAHEGLAVSEAREALFQAHARRPGEMDDAARERLEKLLAESVARFRDGSGEMTAATPRQDMHPLAAAGLGISAAHPVSRDEINCLLSGHRADGGTIEGKVYAKQRAFTDPKTGENRDSTPIGSYDFCPTPDKSVSVAWAFAPPVEQAIIHTVHLEAAREAMAYIAAEIGQARTGHAGEGETIPGHVGWIEFNHFTARRTVAIANQGTTEFVPVPTEAPGDPDIHTHFAIVNAVFCDDGRVGSLDTNRIEGFLFEADGFYHARLAQRLRDAGFDVVLDPATGAARMPAIPDPVRSHFSKRTNDGETLARDFATRRGFDFDALTPAQRIALLKSSVQPKPQAVPDGADAETRARIEAENRELRKRAKDDVANFPAWREQARELGWQPTSFMAYGPPAPELTPERRIEIAYDHALPFLERQFEQRATLPHWDIRRAAAQGLVASGIDGTSDIDAVTSRMREWGVRHSGATTPLLWGQEAGRKYVTVSTGMHESNEREFIKLARAAADERGAALPAGLLERHIRASGLDFSGEHGAAQRAMIRRLGTSGRFSVGIAAAGAGKTAALRPLVAAWQEQGRTIVGASLAWRQADDLADAGIAQSRVKAFSVLLGAAATSELKLDRNSVVVVDELGLLGTRQGLELLRLREKHGFQLVALGDDKQCQSIEAGPIIDLTRRALGRGQVPEILTTLRQQSARERAIVGLLREGRAREAIAMKREDRTAEMVPGSYNDAVLRVARLYAERLRETGQAPTISAPTNMDAHRISVAIREERRARGEVGPDLRQLRAVDQEGREYDMPLAAGDRVRLFKSTGARFADGRGGSIGRNGSVLEVQAVDDAGILAKALRTGREGRIAWSSLADTAGRIRLAYGDVLTINTAQGSTADEHIYAFPGGSRAVNGLKAYTAGTRHRRQAWLITSQGAERREISQRRPLNDRRPIGPDDEWANVARNLSAQPAKDAAIAFLESAGTVRRGTVRMFQDTLQVREQKVSRGQKASDASARLAMNRGARHAARWRQQIEIVLERVRGIVVPAIQAAKDRAQSRSTRQGRHNGPTLGQ